MSWWIMFHFLPPQVSLHHWSSPAGVWEAAGVSLRTKGSQVPHWTQEKILSLSREAVQVFSSAGHVSGISSSPRLSVGVKIVLIRTLSWTEILNHPLSTKRRTPHRRLTITMKLYNFIFTMHAPPLTSSMETKLRPWGTPSRSRDIHPLTKVRARLMSSNLLLKCNCKLYTWEYGQYCW